MRSDEYWMQQALILADRANEFGEVPVGAVVVRDDAIVGKGFNQTISARDPTAHAEIVALRDAAQILDNYRLVDSDLFVTIEPCTMCTGALVHARIRRLIYGAREPRAGAVDSSIHALSNPSLNHQVEVVSGVCEDEAAKKLSVFFKAKRN
ncbi:MAG: tRNA adenosine(34) deaminase TadA [Pseudomonadales bacterium]|jgi:tRNA(adenine34) deaminase|nr:tRNA adenosine(34) deaminase TadA [Pseudomonadales bacterium]MDP7575547.1 tRNA adenosine(34) deaminase TadA [Pseudomonadales bacterium]|tara:strand:- start:7027 stop:7479 length:453 start_codon:yes stop_codon:yes gene_type:complete